MNKDSMGFLSVEMYQFFSSPCFRQESQKQKMHRIATHTHTQESYIEWKEAQEERKKETNSVVAYSLKTVTVSDSNHQNIQKERSTKRPTRILKKIKNHLVLVSYKFLAHRHSPSSSSSP